MSRSSDLLRDIMLCDAEGNPSKIVNVRGHEAGLDYTEITTQSSWEKKEGLKTVHRVYSEESTV